jgi:hypothetical protein
MGEGSTKLPQKITIKLKFVNIFRSKAFQTIPKLGYLELKYSILQRLLDIIRPRWNVISTPTMYFDTFSYVIH